MNVVAPMIRIRINGVEERLSAATVGDVLKVRELAPDARGVAVALNGRVVTRSAWATTTLADGDDVEVVRAMQGG
jgi:sulfur carrier protein